MPNIFNSTIYRRQTFAGKFPPPFDEWDTKGIEAPSKYNTAKKPTNLHVPTIRALLKYCELQQAPKDSALGQSSDGTWYAEYTSTDSTGDAHTDVLSWNPGTSALQAARYHQSTIKYESFDVSKLYGSAIFLLLIQYSRVNDAEFSEYFDVFYEHYKYRFSTADSALEAAAILSDNLYYRMTYGCIQIDIPNDGIIELLDPEKHVVETVLVGEFSILPVKTKAPKAIWTPPAFQEFAGAYQFSERRFKKSESALIPSGMEEYYVVPEFVAQVCNHIKETTGKLDPVRNILMRGPSGTGKTDAARAIAAGVRLPYLFFTCNTHTETMDLTGSIVPKTGDRKPVMAKDLVSELHLPTDEELQIAPLYYYKVLSGFEKSDAAYEDCLQLKQQKLQEYQRTLINQSNEYEFVYGPLIEAIKKGFIFELQEPTVIVQEGILTGLNGLLDQSGSIELPTGELVKRHPDSVIILTTNTAYHGCRPLNQSVLSRMQLILDVELPDDAELTQRLVRRTGFSDERLLEKMISVMNQIAEYCDQNSITDGVVGMRELEQWVLSYQITGDIMRSAEMTILSSSTSSAEDREFIQKTFLDTRFAEGGIAA